MKLRPSAAWLIAAVFCASVAQAQPAPAPPTVGPGTGIPPSTGSPTGPDSTPTVPPVQPTTPERLPPSPPTLPAPGRPQPTTPPPGVRLPTTTPGADAQAPRPDPLAGVLPEVDDPMLQEPAAPARVLSSWQEALRMVRTQSTALQVARGQVAQARAQARQALAPALPQVTGSASIQHHLLYGQGIAFTASGLLPGEIPNPGTTWQAGLGLRVPILAAESWYNYSTARSAIDAAELDAEEVERQSLAAVADAIVNVVTAERLAEVSRVSLRAALSMLDLTRRRARLGAASAVDVLRSEQEATLARAQVVSALENLQQARESLGMTLGVPEPWGVTPNISLDALAADAKNSCRAVDGIEARPDVRAARADVRVAEKSIESNDWAYLPTIDFTSDLTYLAQDFRSPNGEHVTWTIGGLLTWRLYDGGLRSSRKEASIAQAQVARQQLVDARRLAAIEVRQSMRAIQVAESNLAVSRRGRELARETARLAQISFLAGNATSFELVDAARRLREAELDLAVQEFSVVRAKIAALLALSACKV